MKRILLSAFFYLMLNTVVQAQDVKDATVDINAVSQPCVMATYPMTVDVVEGALMKKMLDAKYAKPTKTKEGFKLFKGIKIAEVSYATLDYYFKIEDHLTSTNVYLLISKGYDNFLKKENGDETAIENSKQFLNRFMVDVKTFQLNLDISAQNQVIKEIDERMRSAQKDEERLSKHKSKVESKISGNEIEIQTLKADLETQQVALEAVKQQTATVDRMEALKKEVNKQEEKTRKASKKYDQALEDAGEYKNDLQNTENSLTENASLQAQIKAELDAANLKLTDFKTQLANLR